MQCCQRDVSFETGRGPLVTRLRSWEDFLQQRILGVQIFADAQQEFFSSARLADYGPLSITRYECDAHTMARTNRLVDDEDPAFCLTVIERGGIVAKRFGDAMRVNAGQAIIVPAASASTFHILDNTVFWGIKLEDPDLVMADLELIRSRPVNVFAGKDIQVLMSYCQLIDQLPRGHRSRNVADTIVSHIGDLVTTSLNRAAL
jgi:hypothetical protein